jgi:hypothetical protein
MKSEGRAGIPQCRTGQFCRASGLDSLLGQLLPSVLPRCNCSAASSDYGRHTTCGVHFSTKMSWWFPERAKFSFSSTAPKTVIHLPIHLTRD